MSIVETLVAQKLPHSEILALAVKAGEDRKKVSQKLAFIADAPLVQRHTTEIIALLAYLVVLSLVGIGAILWEGYQLKDNIYYIVAGVTAVLTVAFVIGLLKNRAQTYSAIIMLTAFGTVQGIRVAKESPVTFAVVVVLNLVLIAMAWQLKCKLFPHQNFFNSKKTNDGCLAF